RNPRALNDSLFPYTRLFRSAPERIRRGGLRLRRDPAGHSVAPHPAQLRRSCDRARRAAAGIGDPADLHPRLPRLRRPAAHPRMGAADLRAPRLRRHRLVADPAARPRGRCRRAVHQPSPQRHRQEGTGMSAHAQPQPPETAPSQARRLLEISALSVAYRTRRGAVEAVRGIDLAVARGSVTALVGESGSGKSTAAQSAIGLLADNGTVTGGSITLTGADG